MLATSQIKLIKVRAGFYRAGPYCIHKGHMWCIYLYERPHGRFRTLQEAFWWAKHNQPIGGLKKTSGDAS